MEADESRPPSTVPAKVSASAQHRDQATAAPAAPLLGTEAPGLGYCRGPGGGCTTLPAPAVLRDAHPHEGMGLLLRRISLLPLGDAALVLQLLLQLCGGQATSSLSSEKWWLQMALV